MILILHHRSQPPLVTARICKPIREAHILLPHIAGSQPREGEGRRGDLAPGRINSPKRTTCPSLAQNSPHYTQRGHATLTSPSCRLVCISNPRVPSVSEGKYVSSSQACFREIPSIWARPSNASSLHTLHSVLLLAQLTPLPISGSGS